MKNRTWILGLLAPVLFAVPAEAGELPSGTPFIVNTYTTRYQTNPDAQAFADGSFLVVWQTDSRRLSGQRLDSSGSPIASEFVLNTYTTGLHFDPRVAIGPNGGFAVAWQNQIGSIGNDHDSSVAARAFDSSGSGIGAEFQVNTFTTGFENSPDVAFLPSGDFVVVWEGYTSGSPTTETVIGRRFASDGTPQTGDFALVTGGATTLGRIDPTIATDSDGGAIVSWVERRVFPDPDATVHSRALDSAGTPVGSAFMISQSTVTFARDTDIAPLSDGSFAVVWGTTNLPGGDRQDVRGRLLDGSGAPIASEFAVNDYTTQDQLEPRIAADPDGGFTVGWTNDDGASPGTDDDEDSAYARCFDSAGAPVAPEFQVNEFTTGYQAHPVPAFNSDGIFLIVWDDGDESDHDPDGDEAAILALISSPADPCGNGVLDEGEECDDSNTVDGDCCGATCQLPTGCSDAQKGLLKINDKADDSKDSLLWKWIRGNADVVDFGDPTVDEGYSLCLFDDGVLALQADVAPAGTCKNGKPCWKRKGPEAAPKGYKYKSVDANEDGVTQVSLKAGLGNGKAGAKGKGAMLPLPDAAVPGTAFFNQSEAVLVQLHANNTTACWQSEFTTAKKNTGTAFKAK